MVEQSIEKKGRVSLIDLVPTNFLMLFTPERAELKPVIQRNGRVASKPTFPEPNPMPFSTETVDGTRIRIAATERTGKPLLVLLNPLPQSIMAFAPMWPILAEHFDLFAYDLPGFGRSDGSYDFMSFKAQGDFLAKLIDQFDLANAYLLGPDIGMPAALYYVGTHPNTVRSLIIGDGPALAPSVNGSVIDKLVNSSFWQFAIGMVSSGAFIEVGNRTCYVKYAPNKEELSDYILSYKGRLGPVLKWFKEYPENLAVVDPLLEKIETPTLVFWGEHDALLLPEMADTIERRMPNATKNIVLNAGHFCYQDQYEEFARMLVSWIETQENAV